MRKTSKAILTTALVATLILPGSIVLARSDLSTIKSAFIAEKNKAELEISRRYLNELITLRDQAAATGHSGELAVVTAEISRMRAEITGLGGSAVIPPPPAAKIVTAGHIARDYIKAIKGWAGIPEFSRNNVYNFNIPETGKTSTLSFYASGRDSTNSYGDVFVITPEGKKNRVYRWTPDDFEIPIKEARSYKHLKAIRVDISKYVKGPGNYQVEFKYRKGDDPLGILRVEIRS